MMGRECRGGLQGVVCVVVRVGEAGLERTSGGGGLAPKTKKRVHQLGSGLGWKPLAGDMVYV
jgi:hypothetical protein